MKDMSPFIMLISCGISSKEVARITLPTLVRESDFEVSCTSLSAGMLRNLYRVNGSPPLPVRLCLNRIGPRESSLIQPATIMKIIDASGNKDVASITLVKRFPYF